MDDKKPVLAVLVLIFISVFAAIATYLTILSRITAPQNVLIEKIDSEAVYVRNNGANTVHISSISIIDSDGKLILQKKLDIKLEPRALLVITYNPPCEKYIVKIATEQGEIKADYRS